MSQCTREVLLMQILRSDFIVVENKLCIFAGIPFRIVLCLQNKFYKFSRKKNAKIEFLVNSLKRMMLYIYFFAYKRVTYFIPSQLNSLLREIMTKFTKNKAAIAICSIMIIIEVVATMHNVEVQNRLVSETMNYIY